MPDHYYPTIQTSVLFRRTSIKTLLIEFDIFNTQSYKDIGDNLEKLYNHISTDTKKAAKELQIARTLQSDLYKLQSTLSKDGYIPESNKPDLFIACNFALAKLSDLYPAQNEKTSCAELTQELADDDVVKLTSGHHEDVELLIDALEESKLGELKVWNTRTKQKECIDYKHPILNPHAKALCTTREIVNLLAKADKQSLKLPSGLIMLQRKGDNTPRVLIGDKKAREEIHHLLDNSTKEKREQYRILKLEDVQFYDGLLQTYPHFTISDEIWPEETKTHQEWNEILKIAKPYVHAKLLERTATGKLDIMSAHHLQLYRIIESTIIEKLIPAQRVAAEDYKHVKCEELCLDLYTTIYQRYTDQDDRPQAPKKEEANDLFDASKACIAFLKQSRHDLHVANSVSLQNIKDFLHSPAYKELHAIFFNIITDRYCDKEKMHHIVSKPESLKLHLNTVRYNEPFRQFLEKHGKTADDIKLDIYNIYNSVETMLNNVKGSRAAQFEQYRHEAKLPFSTIAYFTDKHAECLDKLLHDLNHLPPVVEDFLDNLKCSNTKLLKLFLSGDSPQEIVDKLIYIKPLKNLESSAIRNEVLKGVLSLEVALGLNKRTVKNNIEELIPHNVNPENALTRTRPPRHPDARANPNTFFSPSQQGTSANGVQINIQTEKIKMTIRKH